MNQEVVPVLDFEERVVIIAGGAGGLGACHALELARRGARVLVADLGCGVDGQGADPARAQSVAQRIIDAGGKAMAETGDLRDPSVAAAITDAALRCWGRLDAVIASAGIVTFPGSVADTTPGDVASHLAFEPGVPLNLARAAWPAMAEAGYGRFVLTVSSAVFGVGTALGYACAKGATLALGKSLARAGEDCGIRANVIAPYGFTREMTTFERPAASVAAKRQSLAPERVTALVTVLAHERCPSSGELFGVGGGRVVRVAYRESAGYVDAELDAETVAEHWEEIVDLGGEETTVRSNKQFVDRFYDQVPGYREAEAQAAAGVRGA